jgi:hypothetical protein
LYVYVIRQGPNQYPSCALTWTRTSLVQCTPRAHLLEVGPQHYLPKVKTQSITFEIVDIVFLNDLILELTSKAPN